MSKGKARSKKKESDKKAESRGGIARASKSVGLGFGGMRSTEADWSAIARVSKTRYERVRQVHSLGSAVKGISPGDWVIPSPPSFDFDERLRIGETRTVERESVKPVWNPNCGTSIEPSKCASAS
ncbi:hypothetical protein LOK49_LG06G03118 [Camellia lanceoleosa]|uniref:Uncharacterized protein n=1 Tax=Camellia lanceoleosa TaxID=1840588 RepID=A0ACC0HH44_9ERIC|nr:hypothetical protein LOK49_LG06G03118 [Camellia lanceoleosa]